MTLLFSALATRQGIEFNIQDPVPHFTDLAQHKTMPSLTEFIELLHAYVESTLIRGFETEVET